MPLPLALQSNDLDVSGVMWLVSGWSIRGARHGALFALWITLKVWFLGLAS